MTCRNIHIYLQPISMITLVEHLAILANRQLKKTHFSLFLSHIMEVIMNIYLYNEKEQLKGT